MKMESHSEAMWWGHVEKKLYQRIIKFSIYFQIISS